MGKILPQTFFNRDTQRVAEELLGKYLVRRIRDKEEEYLITEVEIYDGFLDTASHAHRGKTKRNEVMFREAGYIYVYLTYGIHYMLNIVTREKEYPAAILMRGLRGVSGPGRLTKKLHITKTLNKKKLGRNAGLWIEDRGFVVRKKDIKRTPRVGVSYAKGWKDKPYRFFLS